MRAGARAKKSLGRGKPRARATARAEALRNSMPWELEARGGARNQKHETALLVQSRRRKSIFTRAHPALPEGRS
jgi:hypothetical protein